jgi:hypothetical protein
MRVLLAISMLTACGPNDRDTGAADAPSQGDSGSGGDAAEVDNSRVYAHSGGMLYRINSVTLEALPIGPMGGLDPSNLLDLAIDKDDQMVGITADNLYSIDSTTGAATLIAELPANVKRVTSLSYAPAPNPANPDILVCANNEGDVFQIDIPAGGGDPTATKIGSYGTAPGGKVVSSGDLIAVREFGYYATVNVGTSTEDVLARLDPVTWKATLLPNASGYDNVFGLGFWSGVIYGFVDEGCEPPGCPAGTGKMISLDPGTGVGSLSNAGTIRWFGAGVSTAAPIL